MFREFTSAIEYRPTWREILVRIGTHCGPKKVPYQF